MRGTGRHIRDNGDGYSLRVTNENFDDVIQSLENAAEALGDRAIGMLRDALESGSGVKPVAEKTITQARRAVEKAVTLLRGLPSSG